MAPSVRTVPTASKARAVQIIWSWRGGRPDIEHIGSGHSEAEVELLKAAAYRKIAGEGQDQLDLGFDDEPTNGSTGGSSSGIKVASMRMGPLIEALTAIYSGLGFEDATEGDEVFYQQVLARLVEPTSKYDSLRVIEEMGMGPVSYATVKRRLPTYATSGFRRRLAAALAARADLGPHALVLFDVSTLYFETDQGDGFREPGFSKERRLEPQITIGLLTDAHGFPLKVTAFEGNKAETKTMIPVLQDFMATHQLEDITIVADAGMVSDANRKAIETAKLSYIIGEKLPEVPYPIRKWIEDNPGQAPPNGMILSWPVYEGSAGQRRKSLIYYQYRENRAKRTLRGIDQQVAKAKKAVEGKAPVKRNRFVGIEGERRFLKEEIEQKARDLAGWKAYITNLPPEKASANYVIGAYHQLWHIEKAFRMSKHDLAARPVFHRQKDSIDAHLSIVTSALAVAQRLEALTGWSRKKFITTARRYREVTLNINGQYLTAETDLPEDLIAAINAIHSNSRPD